MDILLPFTESRDVPGSPMAEYDRAWRWGLFLYGKKAVFQISLAEYLVRFKGAPEEPPRITRAIGIQFRPLDWRFGSDHVYYDGPHCLYMLGPLWLSLEIWRWNCKECAIECCPKEKE